MSASETNSFTISSMCDVARHTQHSISCARTTTTTHSADRENTSRSIFLGSQISTLCTNRTYDILCAFLGDGLRSALERQSPVRLFYILMEISLFLARCRICFASVCGNRILNMYFVHSWPFMRRSFCDKSFSFHSVVVACSALLSFQMPNVLAE